MSVLIWVLIGLCLVGSLAAVQGKSIAVLGMKGAGKTRFYRFLQNKPYSEGEDLETIQEQYRGFTYTKENGDEIYIRAGYDYGGAKDIAEKTNEKLIAESDTVFFIFDIHAYFTDKQYKEDTNARLKFVIDNIDNKEFYVLASHVDLMKDSTIQNSRKDFERYIAQQGYSNHIKQGNLALVNLTDAEGLKKVVDKLFNS